MSRKLLFIVSILFLTQVAYSSEKANKPSQGRIGYYQGLIDHLTNYLLAMSVRREQLTYKPFSKLPLVPPSFLGSFPEKDDASRKKLLVLMQTSSQVSLLPPWWIWGPGPGPGPGPSGSGIAH